MLFFSVGRQIFTSTYIFDVVWDQKHHRSGRVWDGVSVSPEKAVMVRSPARTGGQGIEKRVLVSAAADRHTKLKWVIFIQQLCQSKDHDVWSVDTLIALMCWLSVVFIHQYIQRANSQCGSRMVRSLLSCEVVSILIFLKPFSYLTICFSTLLNFILLFSPIIFCLTYLHSVNTDPGKGRNIIGEINMNTLNNCG